MLKELKTLLWKDLKLEWRKRHALNGLLLYVVLMVVLVYLSFEKVDFVTWNALLWLILLFSSINAVAKSFLGESPARHLYYYHVARPQAVILSKIIYNLFLMLLIAGIALGVYSLVLGFPVLYPLRYFAALFLGASGFATLFTMLAAMASRAENSAALMAILSFPLFIPMLVILLTVSRAGLVPMEGSVILQNFALLFLLELVIVGISLLLFPYIWRD